MTKKLTTEEFIKKAREKHGDTYDYSLVEYINSSTKVKIICKTHGEFIQTPSKHLSKQGCSKCSGRYIYSNDEFIDKAKEKHGDRYDYSKVIYKRGKDNIIIYCIEHGEFKQIAHNHIMGAGCPKCANILLSNSKKKTQIQFINEANEIHKNKYDYSLTEYSSCYDKVKIICKDHGAFEQAAYCHLQGQGCSKCSGKYSYTTDEFIEKANKIHKNKYNYSLTEYKSTGEKIKIICQKHGEFEQIAGGHLSGQGCSKCTGCYSYTTEEYIEKANKVHKNKYDYSLVEYKTNKDKVIIICKEHGEFEQIAGGHLSGWGCSKCSERYSYSTEEFIEKANEVHKNRYGYSLTEYKKTEDKIKIICNKHGVFEQIAKVHLKGHGCQKCSGCFVITTTEEFIEKAKEAHKNKYDYSLVEYKNMDNKIKIICKIHGEFEQTTKVHLRGYGCQKCGGVYKYNTEEFIENAKRIHGDKYDYSLTEYINCKTKVKIICKNHGEFEQNPQHHILRGQGCSKCNNIIQTSKPAQQWIDYLSISKPDIQHFYSENGEFSIPNSKYKADGYDENTNTIYEFHGDFWHGNPKIFNKDEINKITKTTFGELYEKTLSKEEYCKSQGYNYISLWENDWNKGVNAIRQIQRKFKEFYTS